MEEPVLKKETQTTGQEAVDSTEKSTSDDGGALFSEVKKDSALFSEVKDGGALFSEVKKDGGALSSDVVLKARQDRATFVSEIERLRADLISMKEPLPALIHQTPVSEPLPPSLPPVSTKVKPKKKKNIVKNGKSKKVVAVATNEESHRRIAMDDPMLHGRLADDRLMMDPRNTQYYGGAAYPPQPMYYPDQRVGYMDPRFQRMGYRPEMYEEDYSPAPMQSYAPPMVPMSVPMSMPPIRRRLPMPMYK